jgi:hypothetical protein
VFLVTEGAFRGITCTHKLGGVTRQSTWDERLFLKQIIVAMQTEGANVSPGTELYERCLSRWASAVVEQGPVANVFFRGGTTPADWAWIFMNPAPEPPGPNPFDD